jgi:hypothetical protein
MWTYIVCVTIDDYDFNLKEYTKKETWRKNLIWIICMFIFKRQSHKNFFRSPKDKK